MVKIILATLPQYAKMAQCLTDCNYQDRLLSFYLLDKIPDEELHHYVEIGLVLPKKKKRTLKSGFTSSVYIRERRIALRKRLNNYYFNEV